MNRYSINMTYKHRFDFKELTGLEIFKERFNQDTFTTVDIIDILRLLLAVR